MISRKAFISVLLAGSMLAGCNDGDKTDTAGTFASPTADINGPISSGTDSFPDAGKDSGDTEREKTDVNRPPTRVDVPLTQFVDPFIGTGPGQKADSPNHGNMGAFTFPAAGRPFGMVNWGPDTTTPSPGYFVKGYHYTQNKITGFTLTHLSGVGCNAASAFPFLPMTATGQTQPLYDHSQETATPGYYYVKFPDSGIETELTATTRVGLGKFTYPQGSNALLRISAETSVGGGSITVDDAAMTVSGNARDGNFCNTSSGSFSVYFFAKFEQPFTSSKSGSTATLTFTRTSSAPTVIRAKVGLSFISIANAKDNLANESANVTFEEVRQQAGAEWNRRLNAIQVEGGTADDKKKFYTALYHSLQTPSTFSDANGEYVRFGSSSAVEELAAGRVQYSSFSSWDTYRSLIPLQAMLYPQEVSDMMGSLINDAHQCGGTFPMWVQGNTNSNIMPGDGVSIIVAQAHAYGARNFDTAEASKIMRDSAFGRTTKCAGIQAWMNLSDYQKLGYLPADVSIGADNAPTSSTMEYASTDFAISRFVTALGTGNSQLVTGGAIDEANTLRQRSGNWRNLINPNPLGASSPPNDSLHWPQLWPRKRDGSWVQNVNGNWQSVGQQYREGVPEQYFWMAPHDIRGLINASGGEKAALERLDAFTKYVNAEYAAPGYMWIGNEPNFASPFLYNWTSQPYKSQAVVQRIRTNQFTTAIDGIPGNDDLGAESGWLVWGALGLYPEIPAVPGFTITSPLFEKAVIWQGDRHLMSLHAGNAGKTYIQDVKLDGKPHASTWLPFDPEKASRTLDFTLGEKPTCWGAKPPADQLPPSFGPDGKDTALNQPAETCPLP